MVRFSIPTGPTHFLSTGTLHVLSQFHNEKVTVSPNQPHFWPLQTAMSKPVWFIAHEKRVVLKAPRNAVEPLRVCDLGKCCRN